MSRFRFLVGALTALVVAFPAAAPAGEVQAGLTDRGAVFAEAGGHVELRVGLTRPVPWKLSLMDRPARLVVDFAGLDWDAEPQITSASIAQVRAGRHRPGWSRLVAVLTEPLSVGSAEMQVGDEGTAELVVRLVPTTAEAFRDEVAEAETDDEEPAPPASLISPPADGRLRVAIDAGHGGLDPGAEAGGLTEAELMLAFARGLRETLEQSGRFEVVMTRDADVFVPLEQRLTVARTAGASVLISLHADALEADAGPASGMTVYTLSDDRADAAAERLAERHARDDILAGVDLSGAEEEVALVLLDLTMRETMPRSEALGGALVAAFAGADLPVNSRPHRHGGFAVLKSAEIPSILVELGFLSSEKDRARLTSADWASAASGAIRDALLLWSEEDALRKAGLRK